MDRNSSHLSEMKHARYTSCSMQSTRPVPGKHTTIFSFASPGHSIDFAGYSRRPVTLSPSTPHHDSRGQQFAHNASVPPSATSHQTHPWNLSPPGSSQAYFSHDRIQLPQTRSATTTHIMFRKTFSRTLLSLLRCQVVNGADFLTVWHLTTHIWVVPHR